MGGNRIVVFCDNREQVRSVKGGIAAAANRMGASKVVCPIRDARVDINGNSVRIVISGTMQTRGLQADVVYLSDHARTQYAEARVIALDGEIV